MVVCEIQPLIQGNYAAARGFSRVPETVESIEQELMSL
jgi:hypothetical protein